MCDDERKLGEECWNPSRRCGEFEPNCLMKLGWPKSTRQSPEAHELGWSSIRKVCLGLKRKNA